LWILKRKTQCSISTHGDAGYGPRRANVQQAKTLLHLRNQIAHKKIFISGAAALGIDVEGSVCLRCDHNKLANLLVTLQIFNNVSCPAADQESLVTSQAMQKIEGRKFLSGLSVKTGRQQRAVANR